MDEKNNHQRTRLETFDHFSINKKYKYVKPCTSKISPCQLNSKWVVVCKTGTRGLTLPICLFKLFCLFQNNSGQPFLAQNAPPSGFYPLVWACADLLVDTLVHRASEPRHSLVHRLGFELCNRLKSHSRQDAYILGRAEERVESLLVVQMGGCQIFY